MSKEVFVCYSRQDKKFVDALLPFLQHSIREQTFVDLIDITPGENWRGKINEALASARAGIIIISQTFLRSAFIKGVELPALVSKHMDGSAKLLALLASAIPSVEKTPLDDIQWINSRETPLDADEAAAKRAYAQLSDLLSEHLCKAPGSGTTGSGPDAEQQAQPANRASPMQVAVPQPPKATPNNIPARPERFIGLSRERDALLNAIIAGGFTVLRGSDPEIGKTALAVQAVRDAIEKAPFPAGAVYADVKNMTFEGFIRHLSEVACAGYSAINELPAIRNAVIRAFSVDRAVLLLDNVEDCGARSEIIEFCACLPRTVSILITTTLDIPCIPHAAHRVLVTGLEEADAVDLFIQVAKAYGAPLEYDKKTKKAILDICKYAKMSPSRISLYAAQIDLPLPQILQDAKTEINEKTDGIWQRRLLPNFQALSGDERKAFLLLSRLPGIISSDDIFAITSFDVKALGPRLMRLCLLERSISDGYVMKPPVRGFASKTLNDPNTTMNNAAEIDFAVAQAIAKLAAEKSKLIGSEVDLDGICQDGGKVMEDALHWFARGWQNITYALDVLDQPGRSHQYCDLVDCLIQFMLKTGQASACQPYYSKALAYRRDKPLEQSRTLNDLAVCYQIQHKYRDAIEAIVSCINLRLESPDLTEDDSTFRLIQSYNTEGYIYLSSGDFESATQSFERAINGCRDLIVQRRAAGRPIQVIESELSQTHSNIGFCYAQLAHDRPDDQNANYDKARQNLDQSLEIDRGGDPRVGQTYVRLALLNVYQNRFNVAVTKLETAIKLLDGGGDDYELGRAYELRGRIARERNDIGDAIIWYQEALKCLEKSPRDVAELKLLLADVELLQGNRIKAQELATEAEKWGRNNRASRIVEKAEDILERAGS